MNAEVLQTLGSAAMHQIQNCNPIKNAHVMPMTAGIMHILQLLRWQGKVRDQSPVNMSCQYAGPCDSKEAGMVSQGQSQVIRAGTEWEMSKRLRMCGLQLD